MQDSHKGNKIALSLMNTLFCVLRGELNAADSMRSNVTMAQRSKASYLKPVVLQSPLSGIIPPVKLGMIAACACNERTCFPKLDLRPLDET